MNALSIYEKLFTVRNEFQKSTRQKTGKNDFAHFQYFELKDFLPDVQDLFKAHKLFSIFSVINDYATLTIINLENTEEQVVFSAPFKTEEHNGMTDTQAVGAGITYFRRYLYGCVVELIEKDVVDAQDNRENTSKLPIPLKPPAATPQKEDVDLLDIAMAFSDCDTMNDLKRIYQDEYKKLQRAKLEDELQELIELYNEHKKRITQCEGVFV